MVEEAELEGLVEAAARADEAAWQRLWSAIEPFLLRVIAQPRFLGRLGQSEDDRRNIVVAVMARLRADGFHRLQIYLEAKRTNPRLVFHSWLRVVAKRVGIDYLRAHPDYVRRHDEGASRPGAWVTPGTLPPDSQILGDRPPVTNRGTARQLLQFAEDTIPVEHRRALELWTQSESFDEIARTLKLTSASEAERIVRAALERLRRRFRGSAEAGR